MMRKSLSCMKRRGRDSNPRGLAPASFQERSKPTDNTPKPPETQYFRRTPYACLGDGLEMSASIPACAEPQGTKQGTPHVSPNTPVLSGQPAHEPAQSAEIPAG